MANAAYRESKTHRSRFHVTPDRVVVALLALEGFLLLSECFRWFPFNQHKGWTVLLAAATVGATLLLMLLWFLAAAVFRRRFQFSILSLLVLTVVVAIPCSWLATEMKAARKQREAVEEIKKAGGWIAYDYEFDPGLQTIPRPQPPGPAWLRKLLGDDMLAAVTHAGTFDEESGDAVLEHLRWIDPTPGAVAQSHQRQRRPAGAPQRIVPTPSADTRRHQGRRRRAAILP